MPKFSVTFQKEVSLVVEANSLEEAEAAAEKTAWKDGDFINSCSGFDDWDVEYCHNISNQDIEAEVGIDEDGLLELL